MDAEEIEVEEEEMEVEEEEWEEEVIEEEEQEVIEDEEDDPEEEEEEEVVEEEEEEEQVNGDVGKFRNSPIKSPDFQKDVERESESKRLYRCLSPCSSRAEEFKSCPELNSDALKTTLPAGEQSTSLRDTCLSFENSVKEPTLTEDKGAQESCENEKVSERPTGNSKPIKPNNLSLENSDMPRRDNIELVTLENTGISKTAVEKTSDSLPSSAGMGQKPKGACVSGNKLSNVKSEDEKSGTGLGNPAGEKVSDSVQGGVVMCQKSDGACSSGNSRSNIKLEGEKCGKESRPRSFSTGGEIKEPQQKRAGIVCEFFAKGWCIREKSCRFLHVKDNANNSSQQQAGNNVAGSTEILSDVERITSDNIVRGKSCQSRENNEASLRSREISLVNSKISQRVVSSKEDMGSMSSSKDMGRERLKQNFGADGPENRSLFFNNSNPSIPRGSFVHEHRSSVASCSKLDIAPSQPAWTGSRTISSFHMSASAFGVQRQFENGTKLYEFGSLTPLLGFSASPHHYPDGSTASKKAKVSSNGWEPSEPFRPSFVIPPSILPLCGTLYDPFRDGIDVQTLEGDLLSVDKDGDSASGPKAKECYDEGNSSCSQNQYQEAAPEKNSEVHGAEMVATSVVEQNETTPKNRNSSELAQNKDVLKRSKPAGGYDSWHRSNMSSNIKISRADKAADGEVRSEAGMKVMRNFRTAVIDTIKELLKPMWREGRLSKDAHNMIVKKATEKVVSTAVQFHQVPTDTETIEQYLSVSQTKIVKLVEGYVEKFRKS